MPKWLKLFVLVAAGIGLIASLQADVAAADPVKIRRAMMKENNAHVKAIVEYLKCHKNAKKESRLGTSGDVELRALAMAAATSDKSKIAAAMRGLVKATCGNCYKTFHGPKPKKKNKSS